MITYNDEVNHSNTQYLLTHCKIFYLNKNKNVCCWIMGSVEFGQLEITLTFGLLKRKILLFNSYVFRWILNDNFTYKKNYF